MQMMDKYREAFQEEAREVITGLEATLLQLNLSPEDKELVGQAFRALHTIKGSGAMFGFDELAAFTHNLENAFDEVRNSRLLVTPELINLSLAALDQIKAMVEMSPDPGGTNKIASADILSKLSRLTGSHKEEAAVDPSPAPLPSTNLPGGPANEWHVRFYPGPDLMRNGANPLVLLSELRQLGSLQLTASMAAVPPIAEIEPERCYVRWDMVLKTTAPREAIRDVFIFVEDSCELSIEPVPKETAVAATAATPGETAKKFPAYGRRAYDSPDTASSIRVPAAKLDQFVDLIGELVTVRARLGEIAARSEDTEVGMVSEDLERLTTALRESSMSVRMLPIRSTFERFRRLVHDLARDLHKDVELKMEGADTELDKTVIDQLSDPLMHLIRNSMDHGIESPEGRSSAGKPVSATIHLSARHSGASVLICVADDGMGIDADAVRARAIEKGLVAPDAQLAESEMFSLILAPG